MSRAECPDRDVETSRALPQPIRQDMYLRRAQAQVLLKVRRDLLKGDVLLRRCCREQRRAGDLRDPNLAPARRRTRSAP